MASKPARTAVPPAPASPSVPPPPAPAPGGDIRAARPSVFLERPLRTVLRRVLSIAALASLDVSGLALGVYAALALREYYYGQTPLWGLLWEGPREWMPFLALITVLVFWRAGLYGEREHRAGGVGRILASLTLVGVLAVGFALASGHEFGTYGFAPTAVVVCAAVIGLFRSSYEAITRELLRGAGVRRRAVLVGEGEHLLDLFRTLGRARGGIEYEFLGAVGSGQTAAPLPVLGEVASLPRVLEANSVDELIVTDSDLTETELLEVVDTAHRRGVKVRVAPKTTQLLRQRAEYVPGQGLPLFELSPPAFAGADWALKRTFDVVVSAAVVLLGLPLWALIALAIKLDSRGPVLYRDRRIGLGEREFDMLKFRTMHVDAAARQPQLEELNEADGALFKIRDDPRVTRVGALLRRFSIDEVPQVLNVVRGEMSLVGPRPLPVRDFRRLEPWHRKRYLVLPGMTGLWQISGRASLSFDDLVRLDFYYLENWSIWLDITVLLKTIPAVFRARGAY